VVIIVPALAECQQAKSTHVAAVNSDTFKHIRSLAASVRDMNNAPMAYQRDRNSQAHTPKHEALTAGCVKHDCQRELLPAPCCFKPPVELVGGNTIFDL